MPSKVRPHKAGGDDVSPIARLASQARLLVHYSVQWEKHNIGETHLRSVSIHPPSASRNGQWLIVGKAWDGGYKLVAFHRSTDLITALLGFLTKAAAGTLTWKEDTFLDKS